MRYDLEAATDSAALLLFDPGSIPAELGRWPVYEAAECLERLDRAGTVCRIDVAADGSYLIQLYVNESMPGHLGARVRGPRRIEAFPVPTGRLCLAGLEDALREVVAPEPRRPAAGASAVVEPGRYRLTLYRLESPEGLVHEAFRAQAPRSEYLAWVSMKVLIPLAVAAWIGLVAVLFTTVRVPFPSLAAPILALVFALPFVVRRLEVYESAKQRFARLQREAPPLVALLESNPT
jgi:hypothetical protein